MFDILIRALFLNFLLLETFSIMDIAESMFPSFSKIYDFSNSEIIQLELLDLLFFKRSRAISSWLTSEKKDERINLEPWLLSFKYKENQNWGIDFKKPSDLAIIYPDS